MYMTPSIPRAAGHDENSPTKETVASLRDDTHSPVPAPPPDHTFATDCDARLLHEQHDGLVQSHGRREETHTPLVEQDAASTMESTQTKVLATGREDAPQRYRYSRTVRKLLGMDEKTGSSCRLLPPQHSAISVGLEDEIQALVRPDGWPSTTCTSTQRRPLRRGPQRVIREDVHERGQRHWTQSRAQHDRGPRLVTPALPVANPWRETTQDHMHNDDDEDDDSEGLLTMRPRRPSLDAPPPLPPPRRCLPFECIASSPSPSTKAQPQEAEHAMASAAIPTRRRASAAVDGAQSEMIASPPSLTTALSEEHMRRSVYSQQPLTWVGVAPGGIEMWRAPSAPTELPSGASTKPSDDVFHWMPSRFL